MCDCGLPEEVADEDPDLEITERFCPICSGLAQKLRVIHDADEQAVKALGEKPPPEAARPDDGRRIGLRAKST